MDLRQQLLRDEGTRRTVYRDPSGKLTIGCGRNLEAKGITEQEMNLMLDNDIRDARYNLSARIPWTDTLLDDIRRDALVNLVFNCGVNGLLTFKRFLAEMKRQNWHGAAMELMNSDYGRGVTQTRAARLAKQIITGEYQ